MLDNDTEVFSGFSSPPLLETVLRSRTPEEQAQVRELLSCLAARPRQDQWMRYWMEQCSILSGAFLLNADVAVRVQQFCQGTSLAACVHREAFSLAVGYNRRNDRTTADLMVACYAVVPALLVGELAPWPWEAVLSNIAEGQHVRMTPVAPIDRSLQETFMVLRVRTMELLGYDEAYAKQVSIRPDLQALRRVHS
jgi:hypothetical protein